MRHVRHHDLSQPPVKETAFSLHENSIIAKNLYFIYMKTPKRIYVTKSFEWDDEFQGRLSSGEQRAYARWKRKNKIKQLKRSLQRYKRIEHLPFYTPIWQACRNILDLKHPGKKATLNDWNRYMRELEEISVCILRESRRAGITSGQLLERQIRKENP